jgi:3-keto-disaccharide hydrolase
MFLRLIVVLCLLTFLLSVASESQAQKGKVWTDPNDPGLPVDFKFQGEYLGADRSGKVGCQVIALGDSLFQAVLLPGGLPGAGWDGKQKILLDGKLTSAGVTFMPAMGKRKYLAASPAEFSATSKFPPLGQKEYVAAMRADVMSVKKDDGESFELKRTTRTSPTIGAKPPAGAVVLFDGTNTDAWKGGRLDKVGGNLHTDGKDIVSKQKFLNYSLHLEFMLPFRPDARGQARGNSGVYQADLYEVQVLDSFGLDGKNNECGGVYGQADPTVNMCLPPLVWQTYDIELTSAVTDASNKTIKNARLTVKHNGVTIHDGLELKGVTGGARNEPEGTPGPIRLQGHGNPLQYRNIWVVEKK